MRGLIAFVIGLTMSNQLMAQQTIVMPPPPVVVEGHPLPAILPCDPPKPPSKEWTGAMDFGLNGTDGNTQNLKLRAYAETKRERADSIWTANLLYGFGMAGNLRTENRMLFNTKYEWLLGDSPWSYWVSGGLEYDEFRAFDLLLFGHTGVSYAWWKNDLSFFKTRVGFGGSQTYGGPDDKFTPEMLLGFDYEHKFDNRSKLVLSGVMYPDIARWDRYRAEGRAVYEVLIDPERNITFKVGVIDRYVSQSQGSKANDIEYFAALGWKY